MTTRIKCAVDRCDQQLIEGWIMDPDAPFARLHIGVLLDGVSLGIAVADQFRADLKDANIGDGHCAFSFALPPDVPRNTVDFRSRINLILHGSDLQLPIGHSPQTNFWFDRPDWLPHLRGLQLQGMVDVVLADQLCRFIRDGYVVLPRVLTPAGITSLRAQLQAAWRNPPQTLHAESFEPDGFQSFTPPNAALSMQRAALCDPHLYLGSMADVMESPLLASIIHILCAGPPRLLRSRHAGAAWEDDPDQLSRVSPCLLLGLALCKNRRLHVHPFSHVGQITDKPIAVAQTEGDIVICHQLLRYAIVPAKQASFLELSFAPM